jgi:hypothetical protein
MHATCPAHVICFIWSPQLYLAMSKSH